MAFSWLLVNRSSLAAWPGSPPTSKWARWIAYGVAALLVAVASYQSSLAWQHIGDLRPIQLHIQAQMPEEGGWQGDGLRVPSGRTVALTVHGVSGLHTFALAYTDVESRGAIGPGDEQTVTFVAPAPGRYLLHCTTWCSPHHWRMRTMIEVYDPDDEEAPLSYPQAQARYAIEIEPEQLDMPHLAAIWPATEPDAAAGAGLWSRYAPGVTTEGLLEELNWPNVTPALAYEYFRSSELAGRETRPASDDELWALVAYLREQAATPESLEQGRLLYEQNCAACHGDQGRGDGLAASFSIGQEPDFTGLRASAGASPALYYAKIARGGMGTGMPNWGTILTEDELWALVDYLQTFSYSSSTKEK